MARLEPELKCTVIIPTASLHESEDAFGRGIELITGERADNWTGVLLSPAVRGIAPEDVVAVVGHSYFTGREAKELRDNLFPDAVLVHFVHMSPLHIENLKDYRQNAYVLEREHKVAREVDIAVSADLVICIGPRLHRAAHDLVLARTADGRKVKAINCGIARLPGSIRMPPLRPTLLCLGRTESLGVKGLDIFAYMAGYLTANWQEHPSTRERPGPQFIIRGVKDDGEDLEKHLTAMAEEVGARPTIITRPYTTDLADLAADYRGATAFLMPSREEGFGLVACEALSHGVPTLVSENSGIAEVIRDVAAEHLMDTTRCVIPMEGDAKAVARRFADAALGVLVDEGRAATFFNALAERLIAVSSWDAGAQELLSSIDQVMEARPAAAPVTGGANAPDLVPDATEVMAANKSRFDQLPGFVTMSVRSSIVLTFEKGKIPLDLPNELFGVPVAVREGDPIEQTAATGESDGTLWVGDARRGSYIPIAMSIEGRHCVLTAAHVVVAQEGGISVEVDAERYPARVELADEKADWALLSISGGPRFPVVLRVEDPVGGQPVQVALTGDTGDGIIVATDVTANVIGTWSSAKTYEGLFEVAVLQRLPHGISGGAITSEAGQVIGMIIASSRGRDGEPSRLFGSPLRPILDAISNRLAASRHGRELRSSKRAKIGIIPTNELALLEIIRRLDDVRTIHRAERRYIIGFLPDGRELVVCPVPSMGNIGAASTTVALLLDHKINHLFVVGLCGGLRRSSQSLGDVVVSSDILYYEPGVVRSTGDLRRIRISGSTPHSILRTARTLASELSSGLHGYWGLHIGAFASGEKIIQAESFGMDFMVGFPNVVAADTESAGVFEAAKAVHQDVAITVVRGIADFADESKTDADHEDASRNAAVVALQLLLRTETNVSVDRARHWMTRDDEEPVF